MSTTTRNRQHIVAVAAVMVLIGLSCMDGGQEGGQGVRQQSEASDAGLGGDRSMTALSNPRVYTDHTRYEYSVFEGKLPEAALTRFNLQMGSTLLLNTGWLYTTYERLREIGCTDEEARQLLVFFEDTELKTSSKSDDSYELTIYGTLVDHGSQVSVEGISWNLDHTGDLGQEEYSVVLCQLVALINQLEIEQLRRILATNERLKDPRGLLDWYYSNKPDHSSLSINGVQYHVGLPAIYDDGEYLVAAIIVLPEVE